MCSQLVPEEREQVASKTDMQLLTACDGSFLVSRRGKGEAKGHTCLPLFFLYSSVLAFRKSGIMAPYLLHISVLNVEAFLLLCPLGYDSGE